MYQHGDDIGLRKGPPGFWEIFEGRGTVGVVLQIRSRDEKNRLVLDQTCSAADNISVTRNLNSLYWHSFFLMPRQLERLHVLGPDVYFARQFASNRAPEFSGERLRDIPTNLECVRLFSQLAIRLIRLKVFSIFMKEQWVLLLRRSQRIDGTFYRYRMVLPPRDRFWADPFPVVEDDMEYVFFEEYLYAKGRGHISVMAINADGSHSDPVRILEKSYHLSYPFVFRWNGRHYMIPESVDNRTIDLYVCDDFPHKWRYDRTLMSEVNAVDATLLEHGGKWWLFANMVENEGASSWGELFLFHADSPVSENWTAHPMNPVISDARQARPAGNCFSVDGMLIRPSQESSRSFTSKLSSSAYGNKLVFNEIVDLTESEYREKRIATVATDWHKRLTAIHTFNRDEHLSAADAKLWRRRWF
jgi:hypothetical protein